MSRAARRAPVVLAFCLAAASCAGLGGIPGDDAAHSVAPAGTTSGVPSTTAAAPGSSTSVPAVTPTTVATTTAVETTVTTAAAVVGMDCPADSAATCAENTAAGDAYLAGRVSGGTYGFYFRRIEGEVVGSLRADHAFYPASSIKVLHHLHAIRWVLAQPDPVTALATPIPVYQDTCAGSGTSWTEPLSQVLTAMMIDSDNQRTNAVQDFFGRDALNATAAGLVGTTETLLAHRFGCGGPANDPANRSTARDLSRFYEEMGSGAVLDAEGFRLARSFMLGPVWPSLEAAVRAEGEALGLDGGAVQAFLDGIDLRYKAGWWETDLSVGGYLALPTTACAADPVRAYAFAVFVDGAASVAPGFDVNDLAAVVLRGEIRRGLEAAVYGC